MPHPVQPSPTSSMSVTRVRPPRRRAARGAALAVAGALATSAVVAVPLAAPAAAAQSSGTVTVVHGVPGLTVDVYINGKLTLPAFAPDTVTAPISLPAGTYTIDIREAGAPVTSAPAITGTATLPAGRNASIIAHLSASGQPTLSTYVNDTAGVAAGQARVVARHDAAAPAVDVRAGGKVVIAGLANPNEKALDVPAGTVSADIVLAGRSTSVLGPASLSLPAGTTTAVYAVGSAQGESLRLLTQKVTDAPAGVAAGDGGQADDSAWTSPLGLVLVVTGTAVVAAGAWRLSRRPT